MKEDGFTLVEILVTIAIIGILTAIAVPIFTGQRAKANEAEMKEDIHTLRLAYDYCKTQSGDAAAYPDTYIAWSGKTESSEVCGHDITLSEGTRTHSFDMSAYYPAIFPQRGQVYCLEVSNGNFTAYYRSDKGTADSLRCQSQ